MYKLNKTSPFQVEIRLQDPRETGSFFRTNERSSSLPAILVSVISVIRASRALISRVPLDLERLEEMISVDLLLITLHHFLAIFPPCSIPAFPLHSRPVRRPHAPFTSFRTRQNLSRPADPSSSSLRETETELDEARGFGTEGFIVSLV